MILKPIAGITTEGFSYDLPEERIALFPAEVRDDSRLLIRHRDGRLEQDRFRNIVSYLPADTEVFRNNSKVIPARLIFTSPSGLRIELFCLQPVEPTDYDLSLSASGSCTWECMVGNLKRFKEDAVFMDIPVKGSVVRLHAEKLLRKDNVATIRFSWDQDAVSFGTLLAAAGRTPLPPYIRREVVEQDREWYQTIYSRLDGSVAAPTAGLHFTQPVLKQLDRKGIRCHDLTLHVGAGTFQPIKTKDVLEHNMHAEFFVLDEKLIQVLATQKKKVTCVGTTSVRALESIYWLGVKLIQSGIQNHSRLEISQWEPYRLPQLYTMQQSFETLGDWMAHQDEKSLLVPTQLMIVPGYEFRVTDTLVTNFHQPRSTLLLLIAAFIGDNWKEVYQHALENGFRFLSYGDSSLLFS
jgi:S-adenosylmethionine:tRNA ribosyltransferase-isomerase